MSSLFWQDGPPVDSEEWHSLSRTSERVLTLLSGWCRAAWDNLSPEARDWQAQGEEPEWEAPEWVDFSSPELLRGEMGRLSSLLPAVWPDWIELLPGQRNAFVVLIDVRQVLEALRKADHLLESLQLMEKAMGLGIGVARAHVHPYEGKAKAKIEGEARLINSNKGTPKDSPNSQSKLDADKKADVWRQEAKRLRGKNPRLSNTRIAELIIDNPEMPKGKKGYIRKII
jgi:hypothetical protein